MDKRHEILNLIYGLAADLGIPFPTNLVERFIWNVSDHTLDNCINRVKKFASKLP